MSGKGHEAAFPAGWVGDAHTVFHLTDPMEGIKHIAALAREPLWASPAWHGLRSWCQGQATPQQVRLQQEGRPRKPHLSIPETQGLKEQVGRHEGCLY